MRAGNVGENEPTEVGKMVQRFIVYTRYLMRITDGFIEQEPLEMLNENHTEEAYTIGKIVFSFHQVFTSLRMRSSEKPQLKKRGDFSPTMSLSKQENGHHFDNSYVLTDFIVSLTLFDRLVFESIFDLVHFSRTRLSSCVSVPPDTE